MSLTLLLDNAVQKYGERIAFEDDNRAVSYRTFVERSDRLGQSLLGCELKPGETIGVLMHNAIELVEFDAASARFGFVRTMLNAWAR
jgi:non-ribosomal peptide synthetase component E (peptide arylation enzyme)